MIVCVENVGVVDETTFCSVGDQELNQLDKILAFTTYKLLYKYFNSEISAWPADFATKEEWMATLEANLMSLRAYTRIDNYEDEYEHKVTEDAKKAFRFVAEYLEELYE